MSPNLEVQEDLVTGYEYFTFELHFSYPKKKFMTPEDRKRFDDQIFNEKIYKNEIGIRVNYPDEVYTKNYQGKLSTIYLEKSKTADIHWHHIYNQFLYQSINVSFIAYKNVMSKLNQ